MNHLRRPGPSRAERHGKAATVSRSSGVHEAHDLPHRFGYTGLTGAVTDAVLGADASARPRRVLADLRIADGARVISDFRVMSDPRELFGPGGVSAGGMADVDGDRRHRGHGGRAGRSSRR
jgi:hypothetical protein